MAPPLRRRQTAGWFWRRRVPLQRQWQPVWRHRCWSGWAAALRCPLPRPTVPPQGEPPQNARLFRLCRGLGGVRGTGGVGGHGRRLFCRGLPPTAHLWQSGNSPPAGFGWGTHSCMPRIRCSQTDAGLGHGQTGGLWLTRTSPSAAVRQGRPVRNPHSEYTAKPVGAAEIAWDFWQSGHCRPWSVLR